LYAIFQKTSSDLQKTLYYILHVPERFDYCVLQYTIRYFFLFSHRYTNTIKHSQAEEAVILIRNASKNEEKGLYIFISDDGCGFDSDAEFYDK